MLLLDLLGETVFNAANWQTTAHDRSKERNEL